MKILQINTVYKIGSTGKIVREIHECLPSLGIGSYVIYGRGESSKEKNVFKTSYDWEGKLQALYGRFTGDFHGGSFFSTIRLLKKIDTINPDIIHLHLLNGNYINNYKLLHYIAQKNYKTIITLHAEINYTGVCEHAYNCERWKTGCGECPQIYSKYHSWFFDKTALDWEKKAKAYHKIKSLTLVSVSKWLQDRAILSPMFANRNFYTIGNGINTSVYRPVAFDSLKKNLGLTDEKIVLHVTPSFQNEVKGGKHVIALANRLQHENIKFIIIGFDGDETLLPSNVIAIKHTHSQEDLIQYYAMADVTLLTSKLETFSMVCVESLSCGTPVVGFKAGAVEQVALSTYSEFVTNGDLLALENVVLSWLKKNVIKSDIAIEAKEKYSTEKMIADYVSLYHKVYTS